MATNAERFALVFRGLEKAYGAIDLTQANTNNSGKRTGKYKFVQEPRTTETFESHINGKDSIGIVPINEKNECVWGAIDVDTYPLDHAEIVKKIERLKLPLVVCRSKSGGGHIYLFLKSPVAAEKLQSKLKEITSELGYAANTEVFPKQIKLVLERGDNGNFLNLPYFNREDGLRYAVKRDGSAATLEQFLDMAEQSQISEETLEALLSQPTIQVDEKLGDGPPCLQALMRQGFPEGTRNNGLFNVGVYLRKAYPDTWEKKILEYNQQIMSPPLALPEVNVVATQLKKKEYQYKCSDQPICNFCNKDLCRSRKHGVGGGANTPTVANLRKYGLEPPLWFLDVNGEPVELDTEALQKQPRFQIMCMEQINFMPRTLTRQAWESQMHLLFQQMLDTEGAVVQTSDDTSLRGQFYDLLHEFSTHYARAEEKEEILLRRPWTDEKSGRTYFRLKDFEAFLKRQKFSHYMSNKVTQRLREIDGKAEQFRINGGPVRCWSIPSYDETDEELPSRIKKEDVPF
tara:strand:+ start:493 stop:2040 length:1548 start_codon:yes stop_codon:yes gene_type:complete